MIRTLFKNTENTIQDSKKSHFVPGFHWIMRVRKIGLEFSNLDCRMFQQSPIAVHPILGQKAHGSVICAEGLVQKIDHVLRGDA